MSVVAVRVEDGGYVVAADSITVRGWTQSKTSGKLHETNGMVLGGVGYAEETALLRLFLETRKPSSETESGVLEILADFSDWKHKKCGKHYGNDNSYLLGLGSKVFAIEGYFVREVNGFEAIGAGRDFALAAMHLGASPEKAVEVAIELSIYCEAPVKVVCKK